jgi:hypothetical protein
MRWISLALLTALCTASVSAIAQDKPSQQQPRIVPQLKDIPVPIKPRQLPRQRMPQDPNQERWVLDDQVTSVSKRAGGGPTDRTVRIDNYPEAINAIGLWERGDKPCGIGGRSRTLEAGQNQGSWWDYDDDDGGCEINYRSSRQAELPPHHWITAVKVCLNKKPSRKDVRLKGMEAWGFRPDEYMNPNIDRADRMAIDSFERPNCRRWQYTSCPRTQIATGVVVTLRVKRGLSGEKTWVNGLRLICRRLERG